MTWIPKQILNRLISKKKKKLTTEKQKTFSTLGLMESRVTGREEDDESEPGMSEEEEEEEEEKRRGEETVVESEAEGRRRERRRRLLWWWGWQQRRRVWSMRFLAWPITNLRICVDRIYFDALKIYSMALDCSITKLSDSSYAPSLSPCFWPFLFRPPTWNLRNFAFNFISFFYFL